MHTAGRSNRATRRLLHPHGTTWGTRSIGSKGSRKVSKPTNRPSASIRGRSDYKHNLELALEQQLQQPDQDPQSGDGDANQEDEERENQDGEQNQEPQDQDESQDEEDQEQDQQQDQEPESGQQPEPEPGEMTEEEAERLLQGVQEDPDEINRRQPPLRGRRPSKPW